MIGLYSLDHTIAGTSSRDIEDFVPLLGLSHVNKTNLEARQLKLGVKASRHKFGSS